MKKTKKELFANIINVVTIALIVECFLCSVLVVRKYAREDCFVRIEETTQQMSEMFRHVMDENENKLTVFADILAANSSNPDEMLKIYMGNFCKAQYFTAVCIHRADGSEVIHGFHPHQEGDRAVFDREVERVPYVSEIYSAGEAPEDNYFYQAVPIIRNGETVAILYGYISLDILPSFISPMAYDGAAKLFVVDGDTGDFLMDEHRETLGNIYDGSLGDREVRKGYDIPSMRDSVRNGESGYLVFKSQETGEWQYTYYMPIGINNWSMQMTIDEPTAFASYNEINLVVIVLAVCVIVLMFLHVSVLMGQTKRSKERDQLRLHKSQYINEVQSALLNAHNNPEYIERALRIIALEMKAETALLLTFSERIVTQAYYWPSKDRKQIAGFVHRNIRDDFPVFYDQLAENKSVFYTEEHPSEEISELTRQILVTTEARNLVITPILDTHGRLKGTICAVNVEGGEPSSAEMLECVTYDLLMAIMNVENHAIIKKMGTMDYLTNIKNRNSYENELPELATLTCESLWCVFVDVNGLHEVNNTRGHKAGDLMLCAVADEVKKAFGNRYTYRVGGDEFVAFVMDSSHEEFMKRKYAITEALAAKGYFVSVGFEGITRSEHGVFDVERVVGAAEAIMYRDKWEYYQKNNLPSERGHFPKLMSETK